MGVAADEEGIVAIELVLEGGETGGGGDGGVGFVVDAGDAGGGGEVGVGGLLFLSW